MKFFAGVFPSLFHLYSRRVFLNIPLFDEFIRIPKMKSDKPRACTGQKATHLQNFIEKQSHFDHHYKPFFFIYFFFAFGPFFFCCRRIVPSILWYFICFICCGPHFSFVDFLSFCYLILVFRLCDFVILPQFE